MVDLPKISLNSPLEAKPLSSIHHEDVFFCAVHRHLFERLGIKFAPSTVAMAFSIEDTVYHRNHQFDIDKIFGIHTIGSLILNRVDRVDMKKPMAFTDNDMMSNYLIKSVLLSGISIVIPNKFMNVQSNGKN